MTLSDTASDSPRQTTIEQIQTLFSEPPSLLTVAHDSAQAYLDEHLGAGKWQVGLIYIGTPTDEDDTLAYRSLPEWVLQRLAGSKPLLLVADYHVVVQRAREVFVAGGPTLSELEPLLNRCGAGLLGAYAQRLQAWWREALPVEMTRWGYLSDDLLTLLYDAGKPPGFNDEGFAQLFPKTLLHPTRPDREWSAHGESLRVQAVFLAGATPLMLPLLILSHGQRTLLFSPASGVHPLGSIDDVAALLPAYVPEDAGTEQWFTQEVESDPFDALAASYLALQLREIDSIDRNLPLAPGQHQTLLRYITNPHRWFVAHLSTGQQKLREVLPLWLAHASREDSIAYARLFQALVLAREHSGGQQFLEGIDSIQVFADRALRTCLQAEPATKTVRPADVQLTFNRVIAAAIPVSGGFVAGEVDPATVSLTELALENLAGLPHTVTAITLKGAQAPEWLTYSLLQGCVEKADVGQAYPDLLKKKLLDDPLERSRRSGLFTRQLRVQLPMLALELKLKGEHGLTQEGVDRVQAALQAGLAERKVQGQAMTLWPLAFKASPEATQDVVTNHFIIGPSTGDTGVHLLYRPLLNPMLQGFESIKALFDAIKANGPLQDDVLTWIAPARQAVYANGGFLAPHIRRFLSGDEFTLYEKPAPAQLSKQPGSEDACSLIFEGTAQALVSLADRQSVSNAEQRWVKLKEIGWLLFGTVLPYAGGPLQLGGWLVQVMDSLQQDIQDLASNDDQLRSKAVMDVLSNLMVVLAHQATPHDPLQPLQLEHPVFAPLASAKAVATVPARSTPPAAFSSPTRWSNARDTLTAAQHTRARALSLGAFSGGWDNAEQSGPRRGLLRDTAYSPPQWHALVRGHRYRVVDESDALRVISADGTQKGPWLKPLGDGHWDFDGRLRLAGGNADAAMQAQLQALELSLPQLEEQYREAGRSRAKAGVAMQVTRKLMSESKDKISSEQLAKLQARYRQELRNKVEFSEKELQLLMRLRAIKPRPHYEENLCEILESLILTLRLMDADTREHMIRINQRIKPLLDVLQDETDEEAGSDLNRQAHADLEKNMRDQVAAEASAIHSRRRENSYMEQLRSVPRLGRDKARALEAQLPLRPSILDLQSLQVTTLWGITIDIEGPPLEAEFFDSLNQVINRARWASRSLAELEYLSVSTEERIELLKSLSHVYAVTDDHIRFWRAMAPDTFDLPNLEKLQALLADLHQQVDGQLADLLAPMPGARQPRPPGAAGARVKKIIRTRNRDVYVARVKTPAGTAELVDDKGNVLATFTEAEDGLWEPVEPPPRRTANPQLGALLNKGQRLLADVDIAILKVQALSSQCEPSSLQALLTAQANSRRMVAADIDKKLRSLNLSRLAATQLNNARVRASDLRAAAARLDAAGVEARVRASKLKLNRAEDVDFLYGLNEVRIIREDGRVPASDKPRDFMQVYVVTDTLTGQPLCYAHFHYENRQGPADHYTAAHLKSPEQQRLGRQAQAQAEAQAFARIRTGQTGRVQLTLEIERTSISRPLARRLFFSVD
ncbi:hypothetical protein [Pseudomonas salomonii]|uniref:Uncharacterized protein n=2 Tax=Pseudomonas salomonii TaxID=191391 RepID=A0A1H3DGX4_9PSED|nr:hypothetical protein [Pseudomonas salomonii]SDX64944.1 hypothetical protein SAMN05216247_101548 [Pseudomonas salomonii]